MISICLALKLRSTDEYPEYNASDLHFISKTGNLNPNVTLNLSNLLTVDLFLIEGKTY
jgi:hypothetical protein